MDRPRRTSRQWGAVHPTELLVAWLPRSMAVRLQIRIQFVTSGRYGGSNSSHPPQKQKSRPPAPTASVCFSHKYFIGRGGEIRTPDPLLPKQMRYQAALRPDPLLFYRSAPQRQCTSTPNAPRITPLIHVSSTNGTSASSISTSASIAINSQSRHVSRRPVSSARSSRW